MIVTDDDGIDLVLTELMPQKMIAATFPTIEKQPFALVMNINAAEPFIQFRQAWTGAEDNEFHLLIVLYLVFGNDDGNLVKFATKEE